MFDGNGNWTSNFSAQADRDNGIKILASRFDNIFIADIKESFENCLTKDGQITPIGNFNMGGQRITNLNNGVNDNDAVNMSQFNNAVHKTGNETISGTKLFTRSIREAYLGLIKGNNPTEDIYYSLIYDDGTLYPSGQDYNNNNRFGLFETKVQPNGDVISYMTAYKNIAGVDTSARIEIAYPLSGEPYATAPSSDVYNSIVTTTGINKSSNGYVKLGNGIIIQWGKSTATSSSGYVTLPTPFASEDYAVIINDVMANVPPHQNSNANVVGWGVIQSRSTTSFTAFLCNYENSVWWRWGEGRSFTWIAIGY